MRRSIHQTGSRRFAIEFVEFPPLKLNLFPLSRSVAALIAVTFAYPIFVTFLFLPSPSADVREHFNWGQHFPLFTWKHPPFEDWVVGLVALTGARDGWFYVVIAQLFTIGALGYLALIANRFIGRHAVLPVMIAFCGSIFNSAAIPVSALNADQLQTVMWLGLLYHGLAALQDDRWRDWIWQVFSLRWRS